MTICLENSPQIPGPERLDTVWTLHNHQGKPNARKVRMWNPQHLQMHLGLWCLRLTSQQKVKGLALHPSSLKTVFAVKEAAQGEAGSLKIYSHAHTISASGIGGKNWGKGTDIRACLNFKSLQRKRQLYSLRRGEEKVSYCRMENPSRPCHPWTYFGTLCVSLYNTTLTDVQP